MADTNNDRIQVFMSEEKFSTIFRRCDQRRRELKWPIGISIDTSDIVYVSENGNHCVSVFTSEGNFVTSFGRRGDGPGEFIGPRGLAIDNSGVLYVCDESRVQLF